MIFKPTRLPGCIVVEPRVFEDERGYFMETFHEDKFRDAGISIRFVQQNQSRSVAKTLRGLHYQVNKPQAKLVRCVSGCIWDVAVDLRRESPTFGQWHAEELSAENRKGMFISAGFAHGFVVCSDTAEVIYSCSEVYYPADDRTLVWNDATIGIQWPVSQPLLSAKDAAGKRLEQAETYRTGYLSGQS